jgi:hypothetical protein
MASDGEQQRRELEEIRRSFLEMGTKLGSLFEPAKQNGNGTAAAAPAPATPAPAGWRRRIAVPLTAAIAALLLSLLLGAGVGRALPHGAAATDNPPAPPPAAATTTAPLVQGPAPSDCLRTAQLADQVIDMLIHNIRDRRLSSVLYQYAEASQACRKEASP